MSELFLLIVGLGLQVDDSLEINPEKQGKFLCQASIVCPIELILAPQIDTVS